MKVQTKEDIHDQLHEPWSTYTQLTVGKIYQVLEWSPEGYTIINDNGDLLAYYHYLFDIVDPPPSADWIKVPLDSTDKV